MTVPSFKKATPTVPVLSEMGGNLKKNATVLVPPEYPNADEWNVMSQSIAAAMKMVPHTRFRFTRVTTTFTLASVSTWNDDLTLANFAGVFSRTGLGRYTITIPSNLLPPINWARSVSLEPASTQQSGYDVSITGNVVTLAWFRNNTNADTAFDLELGA